MPIQVPPAAINCVAACMQVTAMVTDQEDHEDRDSSIWASSAASSPTRRPAHTAPRPLDQAPAWQAQQRTCCDACDSPAAAAAPLPSWAAQLQRELSAAVAAQVRVCHTSRRATGRCYRWSCQACI
jgi:hypothetical protein